MPDPQPPQSNSAGNEENPAPLPYPSAAVGDKEGTFAQKAAWTLIDWGNSGYGLIMVGPVFQLFFVKGLLKNETHDLFGITWQASGIYALLNALSAVTVVIAAPVLGAMADFKGWTKKLYVWHSIAGQIGAIGCIAIVPDSPSALWVSSALFLLTNYCFGISFSMANAFLPALTRPEKQGSLSGWGFAVGYVGGAVALIISAVVLGWPAQYQFAFSGVWWLVSSLPSYYLLDELPAVGKRPPGGNVVTAGFVRVASTFQNLRKYQMLFLFLLVFLLYNNGVQTVINLSGAYGTDALGLSDDQLYAMFLIVQFVAFFGALPFGYLADSWGNKPVILINLVIMTATTLLTAFIDGPLKVFGVELSVFWQFTILACGVGIVLGGVQSASRSLVSLLTPREIRAEAFGFFSLTGKAITPLGSIMFAVLGTQLAPRWTILSVLPFLIIGLIGMPFIKEPPKVRATAATPESE